jgi:hypothetical protein
MGQGFAGGLPCQAPSEGGQPFAWSPFAHPIPQSRRRASENLFSASQVLYSHIRAGLCKHELVLSIFPLQIKQGCGCFAAAPAGGQEVSAHCFQYSTGVERTRLTAVGLPDASR